MLHNNLVCKSCLEDLYCLFLGGNIKSYLRHSRDRYGKYTDHRKGKLGDGTHRLTDLQNDMIARWSYLGPYMNRQKTERFGVSTIVYAMYVCTLIYDIKVKIQ